MKNILEKIESKFENQKPYDLVIEATKVNLELPSFLRKLCKSAYIAHLQGNIQFCEEILSLIIDISFTGGNEVDCKPSNTDSQTNLNVATLARGWYHTVCNAFLL
ncbi:DUF6707 family protein [Capnocytophaga canis]|uniref:DUF6707 family protein n=1 Tax=Capnocytophaga canis TaxID=1848903 RepID=UPI003B9704AA